MGLVALDEKHNDASLTRLVQLASEPISNELCSTELRSVFLGFTHTVNTPGLCSLSKVQLRSLKTASTTVILNGANPRPQ